MKTSGLDSLDIDTIGRKNNLIDSDKLNKLINKDNFSEYILRKIPKEWENSDVVLGEKIKVNNWKLSKILRHAKKIFT